MTVSFGVECAAEGEGGGGGGGARGIEDARDEL